MVKTSDNIPDPKYHKPASELCAWLDNGADQTRIYTPEWQELRVITVGDELVALAYHRPTNTLHMAIRGTKNLKQWISNFDLHTEEFKAHYCNWRVSRGMLKPAQAIYKKVLAAMVVLESNHVTTWVVSGHSRGAAIATILTPILTAAQYVVEEVHTFGSPKTFRKGYTRKFQERYPWVFRWFHNNDIVARMPPGWCVLRHVGYPFYLNSEGTLIKHPGKAYLIRDRIIGIFKNFGRDFNDFTSDHRMVTEYSRVIHSLAELCGVRRVFQHPDYRDPRRSRR